MINRRTFTALLAGTAAAPTIAWSQTMKKSVFYGSVGPELTLYDIDVEGAALAKRGTVSTPGANIQYVWPHPSKRYLYVVSSDGGPGTIPGTKHIAQTFRIDPASGALTPHGEPAMLPSRPIHCSVDSTGEYLLTAYNIPSNITVHRIKPDGAIGEPVAQPAKPDTGIFAHQILMTPGNQSAILVARGNHAEPKTPEDPGALKIYGFKNGVLTNLGSVQPGDGLGFGPRHIDFHPTQPWVFRLGRAPEPALRLPAATRSLGRPRTHVREEHTGRSQERAAAASCWRHPCASERPLRLSDQPQFRHRGI